MPGGKDPDNRRDFPGGWKEDPRDAFQATGRTAGQQSLFEHVRRLARLRADLEPLRRGAMLDLLADEHAYAFARVTPRSSVLVVFNGSAEPAALRVPLAGSGIPDGATLEDGLGKAPLVRPQNGIAEMWLPARSFAIYH